MPTARKSGSKGSPARGTAASKSSSPSKSISQPAKSGSKATVVGGTGGPKDKASLESKKRKLERRMCADRIQAHLLKRPAPGGVAAVAPSSFDMTKQALQRRISGASVEKGLKGRNGKGLNPEHLGKIGIIETSGRKQVRGGRASEASEVRVTSEWGWRASDDLAKREVCVHVDLDYRLTPSALALLVPLRPPGWPTPPTPWRGR